MGGVVLWEKMGAHDSDVGEEIALSCDSEVVGAFAHESCANDDCEVVLAFSYWGWMGSMEG